jgi:hypothetical protein
MGVLANGVWRAAALARTPFGHSLLKPRVYQVGPCKTSGSRERLQTSLQPTAIHFVLFPIQTNKAEPHRETFPGAAC